MGLRRQDYECESCGKQYPDWPVVEKRIPESIECSCGAEATWARMKINHIHESISTLYDPHKVDPRTGVAYANRSDKVRDFKAKGIEEGDIARRDDIENQTEEMMNSQSERDPNVLVADSVEEITSKIKDQKRQHLPLQETWMEI